MYQIEHHAVASVTQSVGCHPVRTLALSSIPSCGVYGKQPIHASLSPSCFFSF